MKLVCNWEINKNVCCQTSVKNQYSLWLWLSPYQFSHHICIDPRIFSSCSRRQSNTPSEWEPHNIKCLCENARIYRIELGVRNLYPFHCNTIQIRRRYERYRVQALQRKVVSLYYSLSISDGERWGWEKKNYVISADDGDRHPLEKPWFFIRGHKRPAWIAISKELLEAGILRPKSLKKAEHVDYGWSLDGERHGGVQSRCWSSCDLIKAESPKDSTHVRHFYKKVRGWKNDRTCLRMLLVF